MPEKFEVVISGMSGRFPECDDVNTYKKMLYNQENPITLDNRKWPTTYKYKFGEFVPNATGKYTQVHRFDARVFAVNKILAECTDVINRKILEPSFEAIFDAGINPSTLMGANVGCYMACGINEADSIRFFDSQNGKMYLIGNAKSMESNRVSFALNLTGPSITYHMNVLGGIEAFNTAYNNIVSGRIDAAIVGCASSIIDPKISVNYLKMGHLSPDANCRAFSDDAEGYGRSEAAICFYLQRAEDAKRNYATILFSESIYFGSNPYTFVGYREDTLENTLQEMYSLHSEVKPSEVSYIEMDACGVKKMDQLECNVVSNFFCKERSSPLLVGSVKSHVGHTEATAGFMSMVKALFAIDTEYIAPNCNFSKPNPDIKPLIENKLRVVKETTKLPGSIVAVNTIGIAGSLGHVVFKQNPKTKTIDPNDKLPRLILLCGRVESNLKEVVEKIETMPLNTDAVALTNDIFKTPIPSHMYRAYSLLPAGSNPINDTDVVGGENRPVCFLFSGMGSQWNGMGKGLLDIPIFADAIERCDRVLKPNGVDIYNILTSDDPELFDDIVNAFVGIIAIQVALVEVLTAIGIKPDYIIGHSLGENACAYADGCLTLEQSVLASYARGVASKEVTTIKGMMAAIGKGYEQIKDSLPEGIEVACHNSKDNCTLTGSADLVDKFVKELQEQKVFAKTVNVANIAYHSKHIAPAGPGLMKRLIEVIPEPKERSSKWISTSVPEADWDKPLAKYCSAEYLTNNLLSAVLFEEGCKHIPDNAILIEIAPHGLLQAILKRSLKPSITNVPLTIRSQNPNAVNYLLSAIGKLFIAGCQPDVNALYPKIEFPVPRGTPNIAHLATWEHMDDWGSTPPLEDEPLSRELMKIRLNKGSEWRYLRAHKVKGQNIIPPSVYMYLAWHMLSVKRNEKLGISDILFEDIKIHKNVYITIDKHRAITIMIQRGSGNFEVLLENEKDSDNSKVIMTGTIQTPYEKLTQTINEDLMQQMKVKVNQQEFYKNLKNMGYQLEDEFVNVKELSFNETDCFGKIIWQENWVTLLDSLMKLHLFSENNSKGQTPFPYRFRRLFISTSELNALKPGDEILFHRDLVTKRLLGTGIELWNFVSAPLTLDFPGLDEVHNKLEEMKFIPHAKPDLKSVKEFLNLCLQITVERLSTSSQDSNISLNVIDTLGTVAPIIKKVFKTFDYKSKIVYQTIKEVTAKPSSDNFYFLTVNNFETSDKIYSQIGNKLKNLFLLVIQPLNERSSWESNNVFVEITRETFNDVGIYFYKKVVEPSEYPIPIIMADNNWMTKFAPELKTKKHEPFVIIRNTIESIDLSLILSKQKPYPNTRFLYILDDDAPPFTIDNPVYQHQIAQDLPVSIFKGNQWGSYRNLKCENHHDNVPESFDPMNSQELHLQTVDIKYLNYDYQKISIDGDSGVMEYEYGLEYSGISDSGKWVMGLGYYNPLEPLQKPDPLLTWDIPKSWSLEDAATIPLLYAQAYYSIVMLPIYKENRTVFVNSNLAFAEASIIVSMQRNLVIYVSVANDAEAEILKKKFPNLDEKNIISRADGKYDIQLKLRTKGEGAHIVVNSINGMEHTNICLECIGLIGQYVDIVDNFYAEDSNLCLYTFLKSTVFNVLPNKISTIVKLPYEKKKQIHDFIEEGIQKGFIQPLSRIVSNNNESAEYQSNDSEPSKKKIYKCLSKEEETSTNLNNSKIKLKFDETRSYVIIGGGKKSNLWFELLEWMISQGAKKFIVALDNFSLGTKISHQINRLLAQKKTTIILTSLKKAESVEEASNLIKEANNIASLEAVFFVALDPASTVAHNINMASRSMPPFHFVCLSSGGLKECEQRRKMGLPSVLIHSKKTINNLPTLLPHIESILTRGTTITSPILYDLVDKSNKKGRHSFSLRLSNYLPNDIEGLENIGYHATESIQFVEVGTQSKPYAESKGVYPLFMIPATDANQLRTMLRYIHYPTFCTTFSERCDSLASIASKLCKDIQEIQPDGPITIVGETWSSPIAIEVGSLLQNSKRLVEVFLIEGSPATWQIHLKSIGEINTPQFENNFLKQILDFDPMVNMESDNQTLYQTWEEHLNKYMNILNCSDEMKANIVKTLNGIRNRLLMTAKYSPQGEILRHITLFKQRVFESSLDTYCLADEMYLLEEEKYKEFIKMKEMSDIINQNSLFSWWK